MQITVKVDGVKEALESMSPKVVGLAARRALDRAAASARTAASAEIRTTYNITKTDLDKSLTVVRMDGSGERFQATIRGGGSMPKARIPLIQFRVKQSGVKITKVRGKRTGLSKNGRRVAGSAGVQIQVKKAGQWFTLRGAFIAQMKNGHIGVFERPVSGSGSGTSWGRGGRLPIRQLTSIDVPLMFANRKVMDMAKQRAVEQFNKNFAHEIERRSA